MLRLSFAIAMGGSVVGTSERKARSMPLNIWASNTLGYLVSRRAVGDIRTALFLRRPGSNSAGIISLVETDAMDLTLPSRLDTLLPDPARSPDMLVNNAGIVRGCHALAPKRVRKLPRLHCLSFPRCPPTHAQETDMRLRSTRCRVFDKVGHEIQCYQSHPTVVKLFSHLARHVQHYPRTHCGTDHPMIRITEQSVAPRKAFASRRINLRLFSSRHHSSGYPNMTSFDFRATLSAPDGDPHLWLERHRRRTDTCRRPGIRRGRWSTAMERSSSATTTPFQRFSTVPTTFP